MDSVIKTKVNTFIRSTIKLTHTTIGKLNCIQSNHARNNEYMQFQQDELQIPSTWNSCVIWHQMHRTLYS